MAFPLLAIVQTASTRQTLTLWWVNGNTDQLISGQ
jgi:hypothetical protein